jgi:hypothetical protein
VAVQRQKFAGKISEAEADEKNYNLEDNSWDNFKKLKQSIEDLKL